MIKKYVCIHPINFTKGMEISETDFAIYFKKVEEEVVALSDLVGLSLLSGVGQGVESTGGDYAFERNYMTFCLNGIVYKAVEDENDGYRSSCDKIIVMNREGRIEVPFHPVQVFGVMEYRNNYSDCEILNLYSVKTSKLVLSVGTDNTDDYYPSFVNAWLPQNL